MPLLTDIMSSDAKDRIGEELSKQAWLGIDRYMRRKGVEKKREDKCMVVRSRNQKSSRVQGRENTSVSSNDSNRGQISIDHISYRRSLRRRD